MILSAAMFFPAILLLGLTPAGFTCVAQSPAGTKVDLSTVPDTTIQSEDYAEVGRHFHSKLLKRVPAPEQFVRPLSRLKEFRKVSFHPEAFVSELG